MLFSYTAFFLQKLIAKKWISLDTAAVIHAALLVILVFCSTAVVLERPWGPVQTFPFLMESLILFMKMHSYLATNREFAQGICRIYCLTLLDVDNHKDKEEDSKSLRYPHNVTLANYTYFLLIPVLGIQLKLGSSLTCFSV